MKKILILMCFTSFTFGQKNGKIAANIQKIIESGTTFEKQDVFSENLNYDQNVYNKTVTKATIVKIDNQKINQIVTQKPEFIEIEFPFNGLKTTVLLYKVEIQTADYNIQTNDNQKNIVVEKGVHYRGIVKNEMNSLVSFNFFKNQVSAIVSNDTNNNVVIGKLDIANNNDDYIIYSDNDLKIMNGFDCSTKETTDEPQMNNKILDTQSTRCVTMYFEMGYRLYAANGSNLNNCNAWMNSVFNNVQTLFNNDGISIALKTVFIWTSIDPYAGTSSGENLELFKNTRPFFNGDLGQLVTIIGGQGGVAQTINGLCSDANYSFSDVFFNYNAVPMFSWTVQVITHEFGHSLGSPHTHSCRWNGNNTAIDGCGPTASANNSEGSCPIAPVPSSTTKGTIMSYCHLLGTIGIKLSNGFGPQPAAKILANVNSRTCLSTDCINTCISLISNVQVNNIGTTSANVVFTDNDTASTQWEISVNAYPFTPTIWTTITTSNYVITGLAPNTFYSVAIRPKCTTTAVARNTSKLFATNDNFCLGKIFTDSGGGSNEYGNLENWTRTIIPTNPNDKIKIIFNNFGLELDYDYLYIYNGSSSSAPALTTGLTGTATPPSFQSTAIDGALTFAFVSDQLVTGIGWNANLSCATLGNSNFDYIDFTYNFNQKTAILNLLSTASIQAINIYSIDGKLVYNGQEFQNNPSVDFSGFSNGIYIVKLMIQDKNLSIKIVK